MEITEQTRKRIFIVLLLSCIIGSLIQTALNTALTPIMAELAIPAGTAQWLTSSYSLAMGIMVLATAFLIRRFPSRALFLVFMGLFATGLLLAALADSFAVLLTGRILQAIGSGVLMSLTQVVILSAYPLEERAGVMGTFGLAVTAAPVLSPTLSGIIIDHFGWQMIFLASFVLAAALWAAGFFLMKNITPTEPARLDVVSLLLCAIGFTGLVLGLGNLSRYSFSSLQVLGAITMGAAALLLFTRRQFKLSKPFLELRIFSNYEFRNAVIASMLMYGVMIAASTLLPLYNQSLRGFPASLSGLITMPGSLLTALASPVAGKLYNKIGIRKLYLLGSLLIAGGHLALSFLSYTTPVFLIVLLFSIRQIGIGLLLMSTITWGMSTLEAKNAADGTALISSLRTIAGAIGSAFFVSLMTATGGSDPVSIMTGMRAAFTGIALLSFGIVYIAVRKVRVRQS